MVDILEKGRIAFRQRAWADAFRLLSGADDTLLPEDLERLARAAHLTGHDRASHDAWARAHRAHAEAGERGAAARCAFWLGLLLFMRGEGARASGWLQRAGRLVEEMGPDSAESGLLLILAGLRHLHGGEPATAASVFARAAAIGERADEPDLLALARLGQGQALVALGEVDRGLRALDEAMVSVDADEVSTLVAGIVYCAVILACRDALDLRRALEWTVRLGQWCDAQPDLVPYRGQCLVHRSELAQLRGDWPAAIAEAESARVRLADPPGQPAVGMAHYQRAELHRLRGEYRLAEAAYRLATRSGHDPHPGLALLRMAQGRLEDAAGAIRRVAAQPHPPGKRAGVLAAGVAISLAVGDVDAARASADALVELARALDVPFLRALASAAVSEVLLAEDDAAGAVAAAHRALSGWEQIGAPYETARVRLILAAACRRLGDGDTARLEEAEARRVFVSLGAQPDVDRMDGPPDGPGESSDLTPREVEVIRLVAAGRTNREIAAALVISEKTVARHLSNIFTRLGLPNRAAATAYAYEHDLVGG